MPAWAAFLLKEAAKDPKKFMKKIATLIIGAAASILIICIIALNMIATLLDHTGTVKKDENLKETEIYQFIDGIHTEYLEELREAEQAIREKIIEVNTYIEQEEQEFTDPETGETYTEMVDVEKCDVNVTSQINSLNYSYYFAYINYESKVMWGEKFESHDINKKELALFTRKISVLQLEYDDTYQIDLLDKKALKQILRHIEELGRIDDEVTAAYMENLIMSPGEVAIEFFPNEPETQEYMVSFELYCDFLDFNNIGQGGIDIDTGEDYEGKEEIGDIIDKIEDDEICLGVPKYYQNRYKNPYGNGTIASSGCAPTSIAMCLSYLKKESITPVDVVNWTGNRYYVPGQGSSWAIFSACANHWGVGCSSIGRNAEAVINALKAGKPVIASMGPGTFTKAGHLIVIKGVTKDGYFMINDPNEGNFNKYGTERFSINTVMSQSKQFWAFG
ncbi:hypothetical protein CE91St56_23100 [Lachnospiraceae bacterium]|nr:hypothetical protein CE91St56_23100 [Lachnospiraceae bacterium]GKH41254.1 hypothetical protein CE91St57_22280 [Lachnospiraceae bacterium]